ncbi:MAG: glycosyltransferase family 9 protein [Bacteroidia bacterium]|nr:glycosyltransferase family 9 protein [Bacteroidia bacterium]
MFFSAGVGDAVLLVPLVNELKKQGYQVTALFTSAFNCESIFENTTIFDFIEVKKTKFSLLLFSIFHFRKYDAVYLNHFSFSKSHHTLAAFIGKGVYTNYKDLTAQQSSNSIHFVDAKSNTHDALQNLYLLNQQAILSALDFNLHYKTQHKNVFNLPAKYIVIQVSSSNNNAPYKNWAIEKWLQLFKHLNTILPTSTLVLLGDHTEIYVNEILNKSNLKNTISLIGKTTLNNVMEIIFASQFYMGLDSGLMHIAAALSKPTFTIWGASNPVLYGYDWMGEKHKIVSLKLDCAPCSSWLNANTSRVSSPLKCPDFKCIKTISVDQVTLELDAFIKTTLFLLPSNNVE